MIEHILEILASLGDKRNVVIYGKRLNRKIVKIAERLAGKNQKKNVPSGLDERLGDFRGRRF